MRFGVVYLIVSFTTLAIAFVLNTILMHIAYKRRERIGFYRYFTYAFAIINILYALSFTATHPSGTPQKAFWHSFQSHHITYHVWFALFVAIGHCNNFSFVYRYGLVNSRFIVSMFEHAGRFAITSLATIVYFGWRIHETVKARAMSDKLKNIHLRAVQMLIAQTLNPMFLFSFHTTVNLAGMFTDIDFGELPRLLVLFYALFPIVNPIIILYFTDDYKRYLLGQSSSVSNPSQTQVVLSSHTNTVTRRKEEINRNLIFVI